MALVAILGDEIVGVARYEGKEGTAGRRGGLPRRRRHQGRGIGTVLLEWLAAAAREAGIADVLRHHAAENQRMLGVFRDTGFQTETAGRRR